MFIPTNGGKSLVYIPTAHTSQQTEQSACTENCSTSPVAQIFGTIFIVILIVILLWWAIDSIRKN